MKLTDKRILVTGADGFIGSHLTETLLDMGCRVRAVIPTIITQIAAGKNQIHLGDVSHIVKNGEMVESYPRPAPHRILVFLFLELPVIGEFMRK